jgi:hypothetical protein
VKNTQVDRWRIHRFYSSFYHRKSFKELEKTQFLGWSEYTVFGAEYIVFTIGNPLRTLRIHSLNWAVAAAEINFGCEPRTLAPDLKSLLGKIQIKYKG